jgi:hypothetical protein
MIDNLTGVLLTLIRDEVPGGRIARAGLDAWPLHFGNDGFLSIVASDDLAA